MAVLTLVAVLPQGSLALPPLSAGVGGMWEMLWVATSCTEARAAVY
jgi:hypothetical protein